jgi:hypothetical protein
MAGSLMPDLNGFLDQQGVRRWCPSHVDCTMFVADWKVCVDGIDIASEYRGRYDSVADGHQIIDESGGPMKFFCGLMAGSDWKWRMSGPRDGDIGLVSAVVGPEAAPRLIPAIHQGGLWLCRSMRGIRGSEFNPEAMWTP